MFNLVREIGQFIKEHRKTVADINQLATDITQLKQAVADNQTAINAVQSYAQSQAQEIADLEKQLSVLPLQTGGANLDLTALEASIKSLRQQNNALLTVVPQGATAPTEQPVSPTPTPAPPPPPAPAPTDATGTSTVADVPGVQPGQPTPTA